MLNPSLHGRHGVVMDSVEKDGQLMIFRVILHVLPCFGGFSGLMLLSITHHQ